MSWKPDETILNFSIQTGLTAVDQIQKCLADATEEVKTLVRNECDIIFECRVCRNLFRSLANFTAHKRVYCKSLVSNGTCSAAVSQSSSPDVDQNGKSRSGQQSREPTPVNQPMTESVAQLLSDVSNDSDTEEKESSTPSSAHSRLLNKSTGKTIDLQPKMGRTRAKSSFNFYAKLVKRIEGKVLPDIQAKNSTSSIMTRASPKVVPETTIENGVQVISDRQGTVDHLAPKISGSGEKVLMVLPEEPNGGKHITNGMTLRARATPGDTVTNAKEITETERKMYDRLSRVGTVDLKGLGCLANDCAKRFKSLEALACHFTVMHSNALPSSDCLVCGREFQQRQEVLVHAGSDHKDSMREELEEAFAEELKLVQEAAVQPKLPGKRRKQMVYGSRAGRGKSVKRARRNQSTSNIKSDDLVDYKQSETTSGYDSSKTETSAMDVKSSHIKTSSLNRDIGGILHCSKCYQIMIDGHKCGETKKREDENVEEIFQLIKKIAKSTGKVADLEEIMAGESNYQEKPKATGKFIEKKETENHFELKNRTLNLEDFQHEKSQTTSASVLSTPSEKAKTEENRKTSRTAGLSGIEESDESSDGEDTLAKVNIKVVRDRLKNSLKKTLGFQYVPGFKGSKSTAQLNVTSKPTAPNILRRNAAGSNTYPRVRKSVYLEEARARRKMYKSSMMSSASASAESTVLSASERLKKPSVMLLSKTRRAGIPPGSPKRIQRQVERPSLSRRKPAKVVLKKQRRASLVDEAKITKSTSPMNDVQTRSPPQSLDADASPTVCQDHTAFHTPVVTAQMSQSVTEDNPQALEAVVSSEKQTILTHTSEPNYISAITCDSDERSSNGDTPPVTPPSLRPARARRPRAYDPEVFVTQWPGQKTKVSTTGSRPSSQTDSVAEVPNEIPTADKNTVGQFRAESSSFMPSEADASKMAEFDDVIDNLIDHQNFRCLVCRRMCRDIKYAKQHCVSHLNANRFKCSACDFKAFMKGEVSKHVFSCPTLNEKVLKDVGMQPHIIAIPLESNARALLCKYANEATKPKQEMKAALPVASPSGKRGRRSLKSVDSEGNAIASG